MVSLIYNRVFSIDLNCFRMLNMKLSCNIYDRKKEKIGNT